MGRWEFKLPDIGEGVTEGEIVQWLVHPGQFVAEDQPIVEVMTDKATVTIAAPKSGRVLETRGKAGEIVNVHAVLVVFEVETDEALSAPRETNGHARTDDDAQEASVEIGEARPGAALASSYPNDGYFNEKPLATPATRKLARDRNVDLRRVAPSGPLGRVTQKDVETFSLPSDAVALATVPSAHRTGLEERVPLAGLRRKIAQHMALSTRTAAHFTFVEECDVTALKALRSRLKGPAEVQGVKLSFLPFIVKAVAAALQKHPFLNSMLDESTNEIVFRKYFHIGIATATDAGLIVPVVKDANRRTILEIAREIERVAGDARAGKAKLEDVQGSTFTVTSLGMQGGLMATPIINFPEAAILGVHQMKQRPFVRDGQFVVCVVMLLSLSFDHRIVDGHVGAAFAYEIIAYLEQPDRLFLEMA